MNRPDQPMSSKRNCSRKKLQGRSKISGNRLHPDRSIASSLGKNVRHTREIVSAARFRHCWRRTKNGRCCGWVAIWAIALESRIFPSAVVTPFMGGMTISTESRITRKTKNGSVRSAAKAACTPLSISTAIQSVSRPRFSFSCRVKRTRGLVTISPSIVSTPARWAASRAVLKRRLSMPNVSSCPSGSSVYIRKAGASTSWPAVSPGINAPAQPIERHSRKRHVRKRFDRLTSPAWTYPPGHNENIPSSTGAAPDPLPLSPYLTQHRTHGCAFPGKRGKDNDRLCHTDPCPNAFPDLTPVNAFFP